MNNHTKEKYVEKLTSTQKPFIDEAEWGVFLQKCESNLEQIILQESRELKEWP